MSDFATIKRRAEAAREFTVPVRSMSFTVRLPTKHQVEIEVARAQLHEGAEDPALLVRVRRALLEQSIVAWSNVTADLIGPGSDPEPVDISREAVALLLDADSEAADALSNAFIEQRAARLQKQGTAEKN